MALDLTFKQVCEFVKKDEPKLIEAVDKLLGLTLICSPFVLGPAAAALLPTLAVKNELIKIGKGVFDTFSKKRDEDYLAKQQRMQMAYGLLCFTAFFEALDRNIPEKFREKLALLPSEKIFLSKKAREKTSCPPDATNADDRNAEGVNTLAALAISFPHPTESLSQQVERHAQLWKHIGQGFEDFIRKLAVWEDAKEKDQAHILGAIRGAQESAGEYFEAQYFELAGRYEDFAIWANLHEHKKTKELISHLSDYVKQHALLSKSAKTSLDIGFAKLHEAVLRIPETLKISQSTEISNSLALHYTARINEPIIEEKEEPQEGKPRLSFPRVREAFVPQSFRVLRQFSKTGRLEDESTWKDMDRREDLAAFLLSYLSSPYSTETPLVILGHPGSGKSLLTTVLSAQLMSKQYIAVRVPLREVDAEAHVVNQIEERIQRITNISIDSWAKLSGAFKNSPPIVILDGYDELLQASGRVFSGYLKDVQNFQRNEAEQGRPVRVIVTSRVTLIDKAIIPLGATIVRLLEFDERQRERWMSIWNSANANYFKEARIKEFALPGEKDEGSEKILALAQQPLLLLMLALYDSQDNELRKSKSLDRTILYDSLLRRFIERERGKDREFENLGPTDKRKALDFEMHRLGVAALGMYNRRALHILSPELDTDLRFFNAERTMHETPGKPLSQADLLLGSFFFVHKSKAQHAVDDPEHHEETSAFEFLHNTFGEFLTADFILRQGLAEVEQLKALRETEILRAQLDQRLNAADGFSQAWFSSLVYTPLFTRPVVLEMMREWIGHALKRKKLSRQDFVLHLDIIILNQIKRLLSKREMPAIMRKEVVQESYRAPFGLLGHIAIYSMNLILLRAIVADAPFVFDEKEIATHEDGARPWDRLTHVWRSWFGLDNLNGVTGVLTAERDGTLITIRAKDKFQASEGQNRLETCLNVAISLADNISSGITGLLLLDAFKENRLDTEEIAKRLASERIDVEFQITMKRIFQEERPVNVDQLGRFVETVRSALDLALHGEKHIELEHICLSLRRALRRLKAEDSEGVHASRERFEVFRATIDPRMAAEIARRNPQAALVLWEVAKEFQDSKWKYAFGREFFEFAFRRQHPMEMLDRDPDGSLAWLFLLREMGGWAFLERFEPKGFHHEFFERVLDPQFLLELSERNSEVALSYVQCARELGGGRFLERYGEKFLEGAFSTRDLVKLIERSPTVALAWLHQLRILGGRRFEERMGKHLFHPDLFERVFDPRRLSKLADSNPEAILTLAQIAREVGGEPEYRNFCDKYFTREIVKRTLNPERLLELNERDPKAALSSLQPLRELAGTERGKRFFDPEDFGRTIHPRYLLELAGRNPEAAMAWMQVTTELGGDDLIRRYDPEYFERAFDTFFLKRLLREKPRAFAVAVRLARISRSVKAIDSVVECLGLQAHHSRLAQPAFAELPIAALADLEWLARETNNSSLKSSIRRLMEESQLPGNPSDI